MFAAMYGEEALQRKLLELKGYLQKDHSALLDRINCRDLPVVSNMITICETLITKDSATFSLVSNALAAKPEHIPLMAKILRDILYAMHPLHLADPEDAKPIKAAFDNLVKLQSIELYGKIKEECYSTNRKSSVPEFDPDRFRSTVETKVAETEKAMAAHMITLLSSPPSAGGITMFGRPPGSIWPYGLASLAASYLTEWHAGPAEQPTDSLTP